MSVALPCIWQCRATVSSKTRSSMSRFHIRSFVPEKRINSVKKVAQMVWWVPGSSGCPTWQTRGRIFSTHCANWRCFCMSVTAWIRAYQSKNHPKRWSACLDMVLRACWSLCLGMGWPSGGDDHKRPLKQPLLGLKQPRFERTWFKRRFTCAKNHCTCVSRALQDILVRWIDCN